LGLLVGLIASGFTTGASAVGLLEVLHASALDVLAWWKYLAPSPQIVVVGIDESALARIKAQPVPRDYLASVVNGAWRSGARVIGLAVDLSAPSPQDEPLVEAIRAAQAAGVPVVVSYTVVADAAAPGSWAPRPTAVGGVPGGFINDAVEARSGVVREFRALLPGRDGNPTPSFALAVVSAPVTGAPAPQPGPDGTFGVDALHWARRFGAPESATIAPLTVRPGRWERINYVGPAKSFVTIPSNALAAVADESKQLPRNPLRGKLVLIGPTFAESGDTFRTPKGDMAGVEVQANIVHTLLTRSWVTPRTWAWTFGAQALVSLAGAVLFASLHPVEAGLMALIAVAGGFVPLSLLVYGSGDYWVDLAIPLVAVFAQVRAIDRLEQGRLQVSFARYVSPEVVKQVLNSKDATPRTEQREVSILFCDLRDSTTLGEKLSMNELMRLLNNYFEIVTEIVFRNGGMINKFIGDGILAVYNAPVDVQWHADAAVKTALEIQSEMAQLNQRWGDWLATRLVVSVGIHTGTVISGNVGSAIRLEYTIIGDPVNVAARVESLTREFNARILITGATRARLGSHYPLKPLGPVALRGRSEPVDLFEVT
jgi:adenylate cyclase